MFLGRRLSRLVARTQNATKEAEMGIRKWICCAVAAAAIAAPAAHGGSLDPWAYNVVARSNAASVPIRGEHSFGQNRPATAARIDPWAFNAVRLVTEHTHGQYRPVRSAAGSPTPPRIVEDGAFHWSDAGIGAAVTGALMLIVGSAALRLRRTQGRQASA
jgi:hypothetical protein